MTALRPAYDFEDADLSARSLAAVAGSLRLAGFWVLYRGSQRFDATGARRPLPSTI